MTTETDFAFADPEMTSPTQAARPLQRMEYVALVAIGLLFLGPFLLPIHRAPLPTFDSEWLAATMLSLALLAAGLTPGTKTRMQWPLLVFAVVLVAISCVQWFMGRLTYSYVLTNLSLAMICLLGAYAVGCWIVSRGLRNGSVTALSTALVLGGLVSVAIQCLQIMAVKGLPHYLFFENPGTLTTQPFANVGQPNQLAAYLALGVVAAMVLQSRGLNGAFAKAIQVVLCAGVAFTQSRMGVAMLLILAAAPFIFRFVGLPRSRGFDAGFSISVFAGYIAGLILGPMLAPAVAGSAPSALERLESSAYGDRLTMWWDAVRIAAAHPFVGVGVGEYAQGQYFVAQATADTIGTPYAHNAFLQLAAEFGPAVGFAFLALTLWWFGKNWRARLSDPACCAAWIMMLLLSLHGMLEWSLWVLFVLIPVGLLFAICEPSLKRGAFLTDTRVLFISIGLACLLYAPVMMMDYTDVSEAEEKLEFELGIGAGVHGDFSAGLRQLSASTYFKPQADRFVLRADPPVRKPVSAEELDRIRNVLMRLPEHQTIAVYIAALALSGRVTEALPHVERMRVFAVTAERYRSAEKTVLELVTSEGAAVDPLRSELARWR